MYQAVNDKNSIRRNAQQQREILQYITNVGSSLRLQVDVDALLKQVAKATCESLQFHYSALYLAEEDGLFHVKATFGIPSDQETYLYEHPLPGEVVALLFDEAYRISDSYFIPAEATLWQDPTLEQHFVVVEGEQSIDVSDILSSQQANLDLWHSSDMIVVPLVNADNTLLGFFTPDGPLNGLRPDIETITYLELFANQAAVVIEGSRLYREAKQHSEERSVLVEIGRVLSSPDVLRDIHTAYESIYKQIARVMPADAFFIARYNNDIHQLFIEYLIDEGVEYAPLNFGTVSPWMEKLLLSDEKTLRFSSNEAYKLFTDASPEMLQRERIGGMQPSESLLFAPLRYGNTRLGVISVQSYRPHAYTLRHAQMLDEIAVQSSIVLTNVRLYTESREAVRAARESEQMKNHFLMTASHEIRTPLTAIQGYLELLSVHDGVLGEDNRNRFINNARRAADEVILLLSNVMDTGHIEQKDVVLHVSPVYLARAIRPVLDIMEPSLIRQDRQIEVTVDENIVVHADDARLRQVLLNIVSNALKYTPPATNIAISSQIMSWSELMQRVPAHYRKMQDAANTLSFGVLSVRDRGSGIALEHQERLFERFARLSDDNTTRQRGAGLGLYLCRQLMDAMGGCIWIESDAIPGEGTTFLIALPLLS